MSMYYKPRYWREIIESSMNTLINLASIGVELVILLGVAHIARELGLLSL